MTALLGGQVHMNIIQYQATVLELIRSGRLRALARGDSVGGDYGAVTMQNS